MKKKPTQTALYQIARRGYLAAELMKIDEPPRDDEPLGDDRFIAFKNSRGIGYRDSKTGARVYIKSGGEISPANVVQMFDESKLQQLLRVGQHLHSPLPTVCFEAPLMGFKTEHLAKSFLPLWNRLGALLGMMNSWRVADIWRETQRRIDAIPSGSNVDFKAFASVCLKCCAGLAIMVRNDRKERSNAIQTTKRGLLGMASGAIEIEIAKTCAKGLDLLDNHIIDAARRHAAREALSPYVKARKKHEVIIHIANWARRKSPVLKESIAETARYVLAYWDSERVIRKTYRGAAEEMFIWTVPELKKYRSQIEGRGITFKTITNILSEHYRAVARAKRKNPRK